MTRSTKIVAAIIPLAILVLADYWTKSNLREVLAATQAEVSKTNIPPVRCQSKDNYDAADGDVWTQCRIDTNTGFAEFRVVGRMPPRNQ